MQTSSLPDCPLMSMTALAGVPAEVLQQAEKSCRSLRVRRNQMLFSSGEASDQVYFVVGGAVRCLYHSAGGRVLTLADFAAGEMFGEFAAIDGLQRSVDSIALAETALIVMPAATFRTILYRHEHVARSVLQGMSRRMRSLTERMVELSTLEVGARVRSELLRVAEQQGARGRMAVFAAPRHIDIASRISANREAVTREIAKLVREELLEKRPRQLVIRDVPAFRSALAQLAAGLPPATREAA